MTKRLSTLPLLSILGLLLAAPPASAAQDDGVGTTAPPPIPWTTTTAADGGKDWGMNASMAMTMTWCSGNGFAWPCTRISIAHHNKTNGDLMYSTSIDGGQSFTTTTVDFGPDGDIVGTHASLIFQGTTPFISYHNATDGKLKLARKVTSGTGNCGTDNGWQCKTLDLGGLHSSIGIKSNGQVQIAHAKSGGGVKLTRLDPPYTDAIFETVSNMNAKSVRLAVDDINQVHVAWSNGNCIYYTYAFFEELETVECSPNNPTFDAGRISMVVSSSERPHMAYMLNTASGGYRIRHAFKVDYQTWAYEHVSYVSSPQPGTSIVLDQDDLDTAAISWGSPSSTGVPRLVVAHPGQFIGWDGALAAQPGGSFSSLGWYGGKLVVAHYDDTGAAGGDLRFTKHD
jgi:hypothetical protein